MHVREVKDSELYIILLLYNYCEVNWYLHIPEIDNYKVVIPCSKCMPNQHQDNTMAFNYKAGALDHGKTHKDLAGIAAVLMRRRRAGDHDTVGKHNGR